MKIMHGMREVAGQAYYSVKGLRENGHDATLILWDESPSKYPYDICMKMVQSKKYMYPIYGVRVFFNFLRCAFKYDTFHFHFGHSLLPRNLDLPLLKLLKKKIFFEFHGSDIRQKTIAINQNPYIVHFDLSNEERLRRRAEKLSKYAEAFILHDDELIPHLPENVEYRIVPLRLDLEKFKANSSREAGSTITIVHAPSNRGVKGTEYVNRAVEKLKSKYDINYILVENMPQEEAIKKYYEADIIVDQLIGGSYGVFAIESMAMGKPVITYITKEMRDSFPEELPIQSASIDTIEEVLETLICDPELRKRLGQTGHEYASRYHDCRKNAQVIWDIYNNDVNELRGREAFAYAANKHYE